LGLQKFAILRYTLETDCHNSLEIVYFMRSLIQEESNLGANPTDMDFLQPPLFDLGDTSSGIVELFPEVWSALEGLGHPDEKRRQASLAYLAETGAYRLSPLVIYVMATRTTDPDMETRVEVVRLLGSVLSPDSKGNPAPEVVRHQLTTFLSQMRTRQIFALLQVLADAPRLEADVASLLSGCPFAGNHLADVVVSRKTPLEIRKKAVRLIGRVGYLDAIPALERLLSRLESRLHGQQAMPFAPKSSSEEAELLPDLQLTLALLRSP
jgi:HEAT repeat protein